MKSRHEESNPREQDANYNPTARNFDQTDVSGQPERMGGNSGSEEESVEGYEPQVESGIENTGNMDYDANQMGRQGSGESGGSKSDRAIEQDGPVK